MAQLEYPTWTKCNDGWKVRIPADLYANYSEAGEFESTVMKKSGGRRNVHQAHDMSGIACWLCDKCDDGTASVA